LKPLDQQIAGIATQETKTSFWFGRLDVANQICSCSWSSLGNRELQGWLITNLQRPTHWWPGLLHLLLQISEMFHIVGGIDAGITLNLKPLGCFTRCTYVIHATNLFTLQNDGRFFWYA